MWVQFVAATNNQLKYIFAWKLSESSLTLAGLNFSGWDDKSGQPVWCVSQGPSGGRLLLVG